MKFTGNLLVGDTPARFTQTVRSRRFPPYRLRRRRESSTLCTRAPQGALFFNARIAQARCVSPAANSASCPGLTRASMMNRLLYLRYVGLPFVQVRMDCRVKPGNDSGGVTPSPSPRSCFPARASCRRRAPSFRPEQRSPSANILPDFSAAWRHRSVFAALRAWRR
jgi:hypothetical protein